MNSGFLLTCVSYDAQNGLDARIKEEPYGNEACFYFRTMNVMREVGPLTAQRLLFLPTEIIGLWVIQRYYRRNIVVLVELFGPMERIIRQYLCDPTLVKFVK